MDLATIRYFLRVQRANPKLRTWSDVGYEYLHAFLQAGLPVRAVSVTGTMFEYDTENRWLAVVDAFGRPLVDYGFVNVVCGFGDDFRSWTTFAKHNVAITGCFPRLPNDPEVLLLRKYDHIYGISENDTAELQARGLNAVWLPLDVNTIKEVFKVLSWE